MFAPLYARMPDVIRSVLLSTNLEKMASENPQDAALCQVAWNAKIAVDAEIFAHAKHFANTMSRMQKTANAATTAAEVLPGVGESFKRGLGYGTGIGVPLVGGGAYLAHRARKESEATVANIRNQVLLTALGLGGLGLGAYGIRNAMSKQSSDRSELSDSAMAEQQELSEKLGSVGMLEDLLDQVDFEKLSSEAQAEYLQTRALNRGYGVRLLYEAMHA